MNDKKRAIRLYAAFFGIDNNEVLIKKLACLEVVEICKPMICADLKSGRKVSECGHKYGITYGKVRQIAIKMGLRTNSWEVLG